MQREDQTDHGNGGPGTNSSESAVNHLSKSVVRDTEGAAKQKPHATFCGNRGWATAPGDPVVAVQSRCATHPYIKVAGQWQYLYRAIDRDGNLVDVYLSETRDQEAAEALFRSAVAVTGITPDKVTTDKHASYPPALDEVFCDDLEHRTSKYLNNHLEQDHRRIKRLVRPGFGFKRFRTAWRTLVGYETLAMMRKGQVKGIGGNDIVATPPASIR